jgi:putative ABC transport system substrate-binding protein
MRRRELMAFLGGAAFARSAGADAQQPMPVIGYLSVGSPESDDFRLTAFRQGLKETGFLEGQNVAIEYRWAQGQNDRLPALAADLSSGDRDCDRRPPACIRRQNGNHIHPDRLRCRH